MENEHRIALLGGTFNPVHYGHLRLAVEVLEALEPDRVDIVPCASPAHKTANSLLPFALRLAMLQSAFAGVEKVLVNPLEGERDGVSYTIDTLSYYRQKEASARLYFVMGGIDLAGFDTWKKWEELSTLADLVVAARAGVDELVFQKDVARLWPLAEEVCLLGPGGHERLAYRLPRGGHIMFLPLLRLDLSSSFLRSRWLEGRSLRFLTPDSVNRVLQENAETVRRAWRQM